MRPIFVLAALLTLTALAHAEPIVVPVWPDKAPGVSDIKPDATQPSKGDNITRISSVTHPTLTIYPAPADKNTGSAVMICPGGGYSILAWNHEGIEVAEWLNTLGVTGIILKYRVPAPKLPDRYTPALQDAQRALSLIRSRAAEWKINPDRIGVLGFSAGGHLSVNLSNNFTARAYTPIDKIDEVSCRPDFTMPIYPAYLVEKDTLKLSPEIKVTPQTPPAFLVMTQDDRIGVEGPMMYYLALKQAKVPAELHLYPTGGHGYGLRASTHLVSTWPRRAEDWLRSQGLLTPNK